MKAPNTRTWSDLPPELLHSIFNRLSFIDLHRAKLVCSNWNSSSKLTVPQKTKSPWLMLFPKLDDEEEEDNATCVLLYNPDEDRVYKSKRDFSMIRFLANSGNWFLVIDSKSNLYIIDIFSEKRINLPPLESIQSSENVIIERLGNKEFKRVITCGRVYTVRTLITDDLRGDLWVDEKTQDFIVVWFFDDPLVNCVCYCKNGDDRYTYIPKLSRVSDVLQNIYDVVLLGSYT